MIHPLYNRRGIGIMDGTAETMKKAIDLAGEAGKGIYGMKALGGGHLYQSAAEEFQYVLSHPHIHAIAVGMQSVAEVTMNCAVFSGKSAGEAMIRAVQAKPRHIHIEPWCHGCGTCVRHCSARALSVQAGRAVADMSRCVFCGYCGAHCPDFCIKVI